MVVALKSPSTKVPVNKFAQVYKWHLAGRMGFGATNKWSTLYRST